MSDQTVAHVLKSYLGPQQAHRNATLRVEANALNHKGNRLYFYLYNLLFDYFLLCKK